MNAPGPNNMPAGVNDAIKLVHVARHALLHATCRLDDAGYECLALNDIYADTAGLIAEWSGRRRPADMEVVPDWFAKAARDYRRQQSWSY